MSWNTIHVFGYGQSQIINTTDLNGKADNSSLTTVVPLVNYLATQQQQGTVIDISTLHALNIFNELCIEFLPNSSSNNPQTFLWSNLNTVTYIDPLVVDINNNLIP